MSSAPSGTEAQVLLCTIDEMRFALDLPSVREVARAVLITPLPGAPEVVEGVVSARGELVPVYDLRARFDLPPARLHPDQSLVTVWTGDRLVALRCDRADEIANVDADSIRTADALPHAGRSVAGVARLPDGLAVVHDLSAFLNEAERLSLDASLERAGASGPDAGDAPAPPAAPGSAGGG